MKKVLLVVKALEKNGVTSVMISYFDYVNKEKYKIDFACGDSFDLDIKNHIEENGGIFHIISNRDKNVIRYIAKLKRIVKKYNYDVVHIHGNSSFILPELVAAKLAKTKCIVAHSHNTTCSNDTISKLLRPLLNLFCTKAVACGEDAGKWMFGRRNFQIAKNGLNLDSYAFNSDMRIKYRKQLGIQDELLLVHVGCFNYQKNHEYLIELIELLTQRGINGKLLLIGEGPNLDNISNKVEEKALQDQVIFYGTSNKVNEILNATDVFVLPSRFEGLPCVLIEAQANGLPCIVSKFVTQEAKMSDTFAYEGIDSDALNCWSNDINEFAIVNREKNSAANIKTLKEKGYDIVDSVKLIESVYEGY